MLIKAHESGKQDYMLHSHVNPKEVAAIWVDSDHHGKYNVNAIMRGGNIMFLEGPYDLDTARRRVDYWVEKANRKDA